MRVVRWLVVVVLLAAASACATSGGTSAERPVALVYRGPATSCDGCSEAVAALLRRAPQRFVVHYVGPDESRHVDARTLRDADLYAQPGGNGSVDHAYRSLGRTAARAITAYVRDGGHYVGFCMGAYLAGHDPGLGLLGDADTGEWDRTAGADVRDDREAVVPVRWGGHDHDMFVQDAPYVEPAGGAGERVLARFANGRVAALVRPYGDGAVGVVGAHPEADRSWYTDRLWAQDDDGPDARLGVRLVTATLGADRGAHR